MRFSPIGVHRPSGHLASGHWKARPRAFSDKRQAHTRQRLPRRWSHVSQTASRSAYSSWLTVVQPSATKSASARARFQASRCSGGKSAGWAWLAGKSSCSLMAAVPPGASLAPNEKRPATGSRWSRSHGGPFQYPATQGQALLDTR